ncbi:hypothetical protein TNCV_1175271 [Trichonephila clavipes]|nr:hypothetical protein TNCV_1175271 [Trichonephila clavipes]
MYSVAAITSKDKGSRVNINILTSIEEATSLSWKRTIHSEIKSEIKTQRGTKERHEALAARTACRILTGKVNRKNLETDPLENKPLIGHP